MLNDICGWDIGWVIVCGVACDVARGGGVADGVKATDCELSNEWRADWVKEPFIDEECSCRAKEGGGCVKTGACTVEAIWLKSSTVPGQTVGHWPKS
jgi:hypothetical protein